MLDSVMTSACSPAPPVGSDPAKLITIGGTRSYELGVTWEVLDIGKVREDGIQSRPDAGPMTGGGPRQHKTELRYYLIDSNRKVSPS